MGLFIFLKQFVDMIYQWQILDYGMVIFAIGLMIYQFVHEKQYLGFKKRIQIEDIFVLMLVVLFGISFCKDTSFIGVFFKVVSAYLVYFLGRSYGKNVFRYGRCLALAGYFIIYSNLIYRFIEFGCRLKVGIGEEGLLNTGAFYYYKSDYAIGVILALTFIYTYSKILILKWITIVPIAGYMVFYSHARIEMAILGLIYGYILIDLLTKNKNRKTKLLDFKVGLTSVICFLILLFVLVQLLPYESYTPSIYDENGNFTLLEKIMHSRHVIWWNIGDYFSNCSFFTRTFGIDLGTEWLYSGTGDRAHSAYVKLLYSIGYLGCILISSFVYMIYRRIRSCKNKEFVFLTCAVWIVLLTAGFTIESHEATQMSWFPMLFAGAIVTETQKCEEK